jgi:hypothetical protein
VIRRVTRQPAAPALTAAGLPPGTPDGGPLQVVYVFPGLSAVGTIPADALVTSDGAPVYATGPGRWGQLVQAGRP